MLKQVAKVPAHTILSLMAGGDLFVIDDHSIIIR
jgi:hypothetical protein